MYEIYVSKAKEVKKFLFDFVVIHLKRLWEELEILILMMGIIQSR